MRSITPIIAIILLLLMTVAAAGAAYLWITMIQKQISTQTESGLESQMKQMHGRLTLESVWNNTPSRICTAIRNVGTIDYTESEMEELTWYVDDRSYMYNISNVVGMNKFESGDVMTICLCTADESGANCTGPVTEGYNYTGAEIDIRVEPPVGIGDRYNNYQG